MALVGKYLGQAISEVGQSVGDTWQKSIWAEREAEIKAAEKAEERRLRLQEKQSDREWQKTLLESQNATKAAETAENREWLEGRDELKHQRALALEELKQKYKTQENETGGYGVKEKVDDLNNAEKNILTEMTNASSDKRPELERKLSRVRADRDALVAGNETRTSIIDRAMSNIGKMPPTRSNVQPPLREGVADTATQTPPPAPREVSKRVVGKPYTAPDGRVVQWDGQGWLLVE